MGNFDIPPTMSHSELVLHKLRYGAKAFISDHVARSLEAQVVEDEMMRRMIYQLRAEVYAHQGHGETVTRDYHHTQEVTVPGSRGPVLAWFVVAGLGGILGPLTSSLTLFALACLCALVGVYEVSRRVLDETRTVTVEGKVHFDVDHYRAFPDNTMVYPDELGPVVYQIQTGSPYFTEG